MRAVFWSLYGISNGTFGSQAVIEFNSRSRGGPIEMCHSLRDHILLFVADFQFICNHRKIVMA